MPSGNRFVGFKCDPVIYAALEALVSDPAGKGRVNLNARSVGALLTELALEHCRFVAGAEAARAKLSEETRSKVAEAALFADAGKRRRGGARKKALAAADAGDVADAA